MNKSLKILVITLILAFYILSTNCFAVNIDMNLSSNLIDSDTNTLNNDLSQTNITDNSTSNTANTVSNTSAQEVSNTTTTTGTSISDTLSAIPESELGLTNILNILLIAVGFVLILLSIAIFIRLKH